MTELQTLERKIAQLRDRDLTGHIAIIPPENTIGEPRLQRSRNDRTPLQDLVGNAGLEGGRREAHIAV